MAEIEFASCSLESIIDDILFFAIDTIKTDDSANVQAVLRKAKVEIVDTLVRSYGDNCEMDIYDCIITYAMIYGLRVMNCGCGVLVDDALSPLKIRHLVEYEVDKIAFPAEKMETMYEKE